MGDLRLSRFVAGPLVAAIGALSLAPVTVRAQTALECQDQTPTTPEVFGPSSISATSGNGRLSVGLDTRGTVTVFKWPSPSFYDHIKYRTTERDAPLMGAQPNEGALLGLAWRNAGATPATPWIFDWVREWNATQRFGDADSDDVITTFRKNSAGLTVTVRDVVAHDVSGFVRQVTVKRSPGSQVREARLISFANFNPTVSKDTQGPFQDWCAEAENDAGANYLAPADAIVALRTGLDESTSAQRTVALAMAFIARSSAHHVGPDTYQTSLPGSAYDDSFDGSLTGVDSAPGQADAALSRSLDLETALSRTETVIMTAAGSQEAALDALTTLRNRGAVTVRRAKARWWRSWLKKAPLPRGAPGRVTRVAKRSLIVLRQVSDKNGLIVRSIATQPPWGVDDLRVGAHVNAALMAAHHPGMVRRHNVRYIDLQSSPFRPQTPAIPYGTWPAAVYADGSRGSSIPYEIDATGYGIWTLWGYHLRTRNSEYLFGNGGNPGAWPAMRDAAIFLTDVCRDPATGLQCVANEEGGSNPSQTLRGAQPVWKGLQVAVDAGRRLYGPDSTTVQKFRPRRNELRTAIDDNFFSPSCKCYTAGMTGGYQAGGTLLWPVGLTDYGSTRASAQASRNWLHVRRALSGNLRQGSLEIRAVLGNAHAWAHQPNKRAALRRALRWIATVPTNRNGLLGEAWMRFPTRTSPIVTMEGQPDAWSHAMFYLAALKTWGTRSYSFR